jgi:hypothetical protein
MAQQQDPLFYCITDSGDGSANIRLFKSQEALNLFLEKLEAERYSYDLSEGGGIINPDDAMDVADVIAEFDE